MSEPSPHPASPARLLPWVLVVCGALGLAAAAVLTVEKIALLKDSDYVPTCSIDPVVSCGSVMRTAQAELLGFPNQLLGLVGFTVVLTTGVVLLAGARLPRWYWLGLQVGSLLGLALVHWLAYQSLHVIGALCPYCVVVWVVTIVVFLHTTLHNLREGHLPAPRRPVAVLDEYHGAVLTGWCLLLVIAIAQAFWDHWVILLG